LIYNPDLYGVFAAEVWSEAILRRSIFLVSWCALVGFWVGGFGWENEEM
jgi:hypothetical protein